MEFKQLFDDDRAVSPVIGVILMVAITVILAAVIGTFVLGLGDQVQSTTPQAQFGFETANLGDGAAGNDSVTITHESGDSIDSNDLEIVIGSETVFNDGSDSAPTDATIDSSFGDTVSAGSTFTISEDADVWNGETTVRVIYDSPDSDSSSTLAKQTFDFDN